jgi:hypothetical protein
LHQLFHVFLQFTVIIQGKSRSIALGVAENRSRDQESANETLQLQLSKVQQELADTQQDLAESVQWAAVLQQKVNMLEKVNISIRQEVALEARLAQQDFQTDAVQDNQHDTQESSAAWIAYLEAELAAAQVREKRQTCASPTWRESWPPRRPQHRPRNSTTSSASPLSRRSMQPCQWVPSRWTSTWRASILTCSSHGQQCSRASLKHLAQGPAASSR